MIPLLHFLNLRIATVTIHPVSWYWWYRCCRQLPDNCHPILVTRRISSTGSDTLHDYIWYFGSNRRDKECISGDIPTDILLRYQVYLANPWHFTVIFASISFILLPDGMLSTIFLLDAVAASFADNPRKKKRLF